MSIEFFKIIHMKFILIAIFYFSIIFTMSAQEEKSKAIFDRMALAIGVPIDISLSDKQIKRLSIKTKQMATRNGISATGNQQLLLYPEFDILSVEEAEMLGDVLIVIQAEVTFNIKQLNNNYIFHSESIIVEGSGKSNESAIYNAINNIDPKNPELRKFIAEGKTRILNYYKKQCGELIRQAVALANVKQYKQAMALLTSIPFNVNCSNKAQEMIVNVFMEYQNQYCQKWLQKAKTYKANNQYADALLILAKIDPASDCVAEVEYLIEQIDNHVDAKERLQLELLQERYYNNLQIEETRLEIMRDVLTTYYQNQQPSLRQFILVY